MSELAKKLLLAGAGFALLTADRVKEITDEMVKRGEMSEQEAKTALEELRREWETRVEGIVSALFNRLNLPSRKEIEELKERIKHLEQSIERLHDALPKT